MHSDNVFNILCITNILNLACKTEDRKLRENIVTQIDCNKEKKSIKTVSDIQKIMQRDNVSSYYQLNVCNIEETQIQIRNSSSI